MKSLNLPLSEGQRVNTLMSVDDVAAMIEAGASLAVAGRDAALARLPKGRWIGGTTPYFMTDAGGITVDDTKVFVTDFSDCVSVSVASYDEASLDQITQEAPENGFALTIIPFQSACHARFAHDAGSYPLAFMRPTVGWIAGYDLGEAGAQAAVFDGMTGERYADRAVVLHVELPEEDMASVEIVNLFEGDGAESFTFEGTSFAPSHVLVNGQRRLFADYVRERGMDACRRPMVGDYAGARINVALKAVEGDQVSLFAPVFAGISYSFAKPVDDYARTFRELLDSHPHDGALWSCNCILNYVFGEMEGKAIGGCAGPVTFGEIAYQLVTQTLVQVRRV